MGSGTRDTFAYIIILLLGFILTASFLIGWAEADVRHAQRPEPSAPLSVGGVTLTALTPESRSYTWANATDGLPDHDWWYENPARTNFHDSNSWTVKVVVVRNNNQYGATPQPWCPGEWTKYRDYIGVYKYDGGKGRFAIPLADFTDEWNETFKPGIVMQIVLSGRDYYVMLSATGNYSRSVWQNCTFSLSVYEPLVKSYEEATDFFSIIGHMFQVIGRLFTFSAVPEVPFLSAIISFFVIGATVYVAYTVVQRMWSGGG